jgi:hypothetical protein
MKALTERRIGQPILRRLHGPVLHRQIDLHAVTTAASAAIGEDDTHERIELHGPPVDTNWTVPQHCADEGGTSELATNRAGSAREQTRTVLELQREGGCPHIDHHATCRGLCWAHTPPAFHLVVTCSSCSMIRLFDAEALGMIAT